MKLKLAIAFFAVATFFSIAGADAVTLSPSNEIQAMKSEAVKVRCIAARRCWWHRGRRVCRRTTVCR